MIFRKADKSEIEICTEIVKIEILEKNSSISDKIVKIIGLRI